MLVSIDMPLKRYGTARLRVSRLSTGRRNRPLRLAGLVVYIGCGFSCQFVVPTRPQPL
jgi:hypothetical protein